MDGNGFMDVTGRWAWARVVLLPLAFLPHAVPGLTTLGLAAMALLSIVCLADAIVSNRIATRTAHGVRQ